MEAHFEPRSEAPRDRVARFVTFGCKVNRYETEVIRQRLSEAGWNTDLTEDGDGPADVIVVNTCTVTDKGAAQARKAVRRLARENPDASIFLTGCYAASDPEEAAALPNVVGVLRNEAKGDLVRILGGRSDRPFIEETVPVFPDRTRAFVKIEDGCHLRCTYCIIPAVRPAVASKRMDTVVEEVRRLCESGHREVVVTGVHVGAYGRDLCEADPRNALTRLLARLLSETRVPRFRLSSIEANEVTTELIDLFAREPRLAPHFHLPLQSGSADVLRRMRRRYSPRGFLCTVERIRDRIPDAALTTDVIAGFPGESDAHFEETLSLMRRSGFMKTHVFPFSARHGTPAATMDGPVEAREIRRRVTAADDLGRELAAAFATGLLGRTEMAILEGRRIRGRLTGFTERYVRVHVDGPDELMARMVRVRLTAVGAGGVRAEVV